MTADFFACGGKAHLPQSSAILGPGVSPAGNNAPWLSLSEAKLSQLAGAFAALCFVQKGRVLVVSFARLALLNYLCRILRNIWVN